MVLLTTWQARSFWSWKARAAEVAILPGPDHEERPLGDVPQDALRELEGRLARRDAPVRDGRDGPDALTDAERRGEEPVEELARALHHPARGRRRP